MYNSAPDTLKHINRVQDLIMACRRNLTRRGAFHDDSKLEEPEKSVFDRVTPRLKELTFGTPEYEAQLADMQVALGHHYANNDHHPQHWGSENPCAKMSLLSLTEMLCDWKAAGERMSDGNIYKSIEHNQTRFGYSDDIKQILINTAKELCWLS